MSTRAGQLIERLKTLVDLVVDPLRVDDGPNKFTLSIPETHTTTIDGDVGWDSRPPATLECPQCESEIYQHRSHDDIDCPRCRYESDFEGFSKVELLRLTCPKCRAVMDHGQRHPESLDVPEWATCDNCRYHWEYRHSF